MISILKEVNAKTYLERYHVSIMDQNYDFEQMNLSVPITFVPIFIL